MSAGAAAAGEFGVVLFQSANGALLAERLLTDADVPHKVIPVPRRIASDCGVCVRFHRSDRMRVEAVLRDRELGITGYRDL